MSTKKTFNDDDIVIMIYRIENRIVKEKNYLGKLKPKVKQLAEQGIDSALFALEMEPVINDILKHSGATREKLQ